MYDTYAHTKPRGRPRNLSFRYSFPQGRRLFRFAASLPVVQSRRDGHRHRAQLSRVLTRPYFRRSRFWSPKKNDDFCAREIRAAERTVCVGWIETRGRRRLAVINSSRATGVRGGTRRLAFFKIQKVQTGRQIYDRRDVIICTALGGSRTIISPRVFFVVMYTITRTTVAAASKMSTNKTRTG